MKLWRLAAAMVIATVAGYFAHDEEIQMLVTVGAFLGAISVVMPHNRTRFEAVTVTSLAMLVASVIGLVVGPTWAVVLPVIFVMFLICGMLTAVSLGSSMRTIVVTIVFLAFAEIEPTLGADHAEIVLYFLLGMVITGLCQFLPPYHARHSAQQRAVAALYRAVGSGVPADGALNAADRSLAHVQPGDHPERRRLRQLVSRAEESGQILRALQNVPEEYTRQAEQWSDAAKQQLRAISSRIVSLRAPRPFGEAQWPGEAPTPLVRDLVTAVDTATRLAAGEPAPVDSGQRQTPSSVELILDELRWDSPVVRHAVRLAVTCLVGQLIGIGLGQVMGSGTFMTGHGFWVVVAAALIVFPDYGMTFARGFGRTVGTAVGMVAGIGLSFIPYQPVLHGTILLVLFLGYLAFRSCGQPYTMFWVVAWIAALTPGPLGATTRGLGTLVGCLVAFAAYLLFPTWQRSLLAARLRDWAESLADHLEMLARMWSVDSTDNRQTVARAAVRARITRLDFSVSVGRALLEPADRTGRWDDAALKCAADGVENTGQQVAALSALAPQWDDAAREEMCRRARDLAGALRSPERRTDAEFGGRALLLSADATTATTFAGVTGEAVAVLNLEESQVRG